jgi:IS30 family transposase
MCWDAIDAVSTDMNEDHSPPSQRICRPLKIQLKIPAIYEYVRHSASETSEIWKSAVLSRGQSKVERRRTTCRWRAGNKPKDANPKDPGTNGGKNETCNSRNS